MARYTSRCTPVLYISMIKVLYEFLQQHLYNYVIMLLCYNFRCTPILNISMIKVICDFHFSAPLQDYCYTSILAPIVTLSSEHTPLYRYTCRTLRVLVQVIKERDAGVDNQGGRTWADRQTSIYCINIVYIPKTCHF